MWTKDDTDKVREFTSKYADGVGPVYLRKAVNEIEQLQNSLQRAEDLLSDAFSQLHDNPALSVTEDLAAYFKKECWQGEYYSYEDLPDEYWQWREELLKENEVRVKAMPSLGKIIGYRPVDFEHQRKQIQEKRLDI